MTDIETTFEITRNVSPGHNASDATEEDAKDNRKVSGIACSVVYAKRC